ncbi:MAG: hypothetical protein FJY92_09920 [Candidatus Hydrogenedentes bacterium]|nr:hypothetical protein [Candidatus Hydrogenedentota bacterium]
MDKVDRDFDTGLTVVPGILSGTWPNFSVVLITATLLFATNFRMPFRKFVKFSFGAAAGATIYEIAQLWIPFRTFDWLDILASLAGALASIGAARIAFYKRALSE